MSPELLRRIAAAVDSGKGLDSDPELARRMAEDPELASFAETYLRADQALRHWPPPARGELDWEELAVRIEGALDSPPLEELDVTAAPHFEDDKSAAPASLSDPIITPVKNPVGWAPPPPFARAEPKDRKRQVASLDAARARRMKLFGVVSAFAAAAVVGLAFMSTLQTRDSAPASERAAEEVATVSARAAAAPSGTGAPPSPAPVVTVQSAPIPDGDGVGEGVEAGFRYAPEDAPTAAEIAAPTDPAEPVAQENRSARRGGAEARAIERVVRTQCPSEAGTLDAKVTFAEGRVANVVVRGSPDLSPVAVVCAERALRASSLRAPADAGDVEVTVVFATPR